MPNKPRKEEISMDASFTQLFEVFAPEGVWAILCLVLIIHTLRRQEKRDARQDARDEKRDARQDARDKKYQDIIAKLTTCLDKLNKLDDLDEIKRILNEKLQ